MWIHRHKHTEKSPCDAPMGVIPLQAKDCQQTPEAGRGKMDPPLKPPEGINSGLWAGVKETPSANCNGVDVFRVIILNFLSLEM